MIRASVQSELDKELLRLKGLVLARALLEDRGATAAEIEAHTLEIERVRARLAELASRSWEPRTPSPGNRTVSPSARSLVETSA